MTRIDIQSTGVVTEEMIETLVRTFYSRIQEHQILGPIFANEIDGDWEPHLQKMCSFWSSAVLKSGSYDGRPMVVHKRLADKQVTPLRAEHFDEWLQLFKETASDIFSAEVADHFIEKAERIADSLRLGIFYRVA
jgi:hemoglobin